MRSLGWCLHSGVRQAAIHREEMLEEDSMPLEDGDAEGSRGKMDDECSMDNKW